MKALLFSINIPQVIAPDFVKYGPFKKGEIILDIHIPKNILKVLLARKAVIELSLEEAIILNSEKYSYGLAKGRIESPVIVKVDVEKDTRQYLCFKTKEDAESYLAEKIQEYKRKGLPLHELEDSVYQGEKVRYIMKSKE